MKINFLVLIILLSILSSLLTNDIPLIQQWPLFEALRTTSGMIFTVLGIWLAIMYPERLRMREIDHDYQSITYSHDFNELFNPIVASLLILSVVLLLGILAPLFKSYSFFINHTFFLRKFLFFILVLLTLIQIWAVLGALLPASRIKLFSDKTLKKKETEQARNKKRKKVNH